MRSHHLLVLIKRYPPIACTRATRKKCACVSRTTPCAPRHCGGHHGVMVEPLESTCAKVSSTSVAICSSVRSSMFSESAALSS